MPVADDPTPILPRRATRPRTTSTDRPGGAAASTGPKARDGQTAAGRPEPAEPAARTSAPTAPPAPGIAPGRSIPPPPTAAPAPQVDARSGGAPLDAARPDAARSSAAQLDGTRSDSTRPGSPAGSGEPDTMPWYQSAAVAEAPAGPAGPPPAHPPRPSGTPGPQRLRRSAARIATAGACLVLGVGLLGGAAAGAWLTGDSDEPPSPEARYAQARGIWRSAPVDDLFPRTLRGTGAGPGGADRTWTRIAVAPDSSCGGAFDPLLDKALSPVGCKRLLRATYTDATRTSVTTVGVLVTKADPAGMRALNKRFTGEKLDRRADLMPRPYPAKDTEAAEFGDEQRVTWRIQVLTDAPAVVYSVTGFADGRQATEPRPAGGTTASDATGAAELSGLAYDARGVAAGVTRAFRAAVSDAVREDPS